MRVSDISERCPGMQCVLLSGSVSAGVHVLCCILFVMLAVSLVGSGSVGRRTVRHPASWPDIQWMAAHSPLEWTWLVAAGEMRKSAITSPSHTDEQP